MDSWLAYAGLAGLGGLVFTLRNTLMGVWQYLSSFLVVHVNCYWLVSDAVVDYCYAQMRGSPYGVLDYTAILNPMQRCDGHPVLLLQTATSSTRMFWWKGCPVWLSPQTGNASTYSPASLRLTYIRGTLDHEQLMLTALEHRRQAASRSGRRYDVIRISGRGAGDGRQDNGVWSASPPASSASGNPAEAGLNRISGVVGRIVGHRLEDMTPPPTQSLERLSLSVEMQRVVDDMQDWITSREWFQEVGVPWRRGYLLHGEPGTGKTSMVKALATLHDLPLIVLELATLTDAELFDALKTVARHVPAIVLIEDIDSVFDGREPATPRISCTFSALLNILDGVGTPEGMALFVTTNKPELLDSALAGKHGSEVCVTRPGRIDVVAQTALLDRDGRVQLARRIFNEFPDGNEQAELMADEVVDVSGAIFQEACRRWAMRRRFGDLKHGE